jgi:predicted secreted hydrolase
MPFEKHHKPVLVDAFINCDQTVMDVRLNRRFPKVIFREGRTGVTGGEVNLTSIYQDLPWSEMYSGVQTCAQS